MTVRATPAGRLPSRPRILRTPSQQICVLSLSPAHREVRTEPQAVSSLDLGIPAQVARGLGRIGVEAMPLVARTCGPFEACLAGPINANRPVDYPYSDRFWPEPSPGY